MSSSWPPPSDPWSGASSSDQPGVDPTAPSTPEPAPPGLPDPYQAPVQYGTPSPYETPSPYATPSPSPAPAPYTGQQPYGYPGAASPGPYYGQPFPGNNTGLIAMILGIVSMVMCGPFTGIPAIIMGFSGRRKVREGLANNDGMALTGIILGAISTIGGVLLVIYVVVVIGIAASNTGGFTHS